MQKFDERLTEGPLAKGMLLFALPILYGNVLQSLNGTINSIWIGRFLGENAFAGTANANMVIFLLISSMIGISMASTILVAQSIGARNEDQTKCVVGTSFTFFLVFALVVTMVGIVFAYPILRAMHTPHGALDAAAIYLRVIFIGNPFLFMYQFIMGILRGTGDSKTPFLFLLISTGIDTVLNPTMIFLFHLGVGGSAASTTIAQVVSLIGLVYILYKRRNIVCLYRGDFHYLKPDMRIIKSMVFKGIPMGLQMIVVSSSAIAMMNLVNSFGTAATAAFAAAMQLNSYVQMPAMAIGQAVSTVAAQNVGAGNWKRVHQSTWMGTLFNVAMTGVLVTIIYIFNKEALSLFLHKGEAMTIGIRVNDITLWGFILFGVSFVVSGVVRATGAVMVPLLTTFIGLWVVRIPVSYYLGHTIGLDGLWWSFPIGFVVGTSLSILYYVFGNWKQARMLA